MTATIQQTAAQRRVARDFDWRKARTETLGTGTVRTSWTSRCGGYRVEELRHDGLGVNCLAIGLDYVPHKILGRDRSAEALKRRCEQLAAGLIRPEQF